MRDNYLYFKFYLSLMYARGDRCEYVDTSCFSCLTYFCGNLISWKWSGHISQDLNFAIYPKILIFISKQLVSEFAQLISSSQAILSNGTELKTVRRYSLPQSRAIQSTRNRCLRKNSWLTITCQSNVPAFSPLGSVACWFLKEWYSIKFRVVNSFRGNLFRNFLAIIIHCKILALYSIFWKSWKLSLAKTNNNKLVPTNKLTDSVMFIF